MIRTLKMTTASLANTLSTGIRIFLNLQLSVSNDSSHRIRLSTHCAALLVRGCMNTIYLRHRIGKYPDSPSTRYRIRCGFSSVSPLWKADSKLSGFAAAFRGRRPYPERKVAKSKISEYLCTKSETTPSQQ